MRVNWLLLTSAPTVLYVANVAVGWVWSEPPLLPPENIAMPAPIVANVAPAVIPAVAQENLLLNFGQISGFFLRKSGFVQLLFNWTA